MCFAVSRNLTCLYELALSFCLNYLNSHVLSPIIILGIGSLISPAGLSEKQGSDQCMFSMLQCGENKYLKVCVLSCVTHHVLFAEHAEPLADQGVDLILTPSGAHSPKMKICALF